MGAAAQHRGNSVIRWQLSKEFDERTASTEAIRQLEIAEECNAFVRAAMDYLIEPKGLRKATIERARTRRGWTKRHAAVGLAHSTWVDVDTRNAYQYWMASVNRAKAVHVLLVFALGTWTIPAHITVPRAAV